MTFSPLISENKQLAPAYLQKYDLRTRYTRIFTHAWDFIVKKTPSAAWQSLRKYKLTEQKLWYKYTNKDVILGVRFGTITTYGLYDIDDNSPYHPDGQKEAIERLQSELEEWGICRVVPIQSSSNKGIHLYFFLDRPVSTFRLACVMRNASANAGLILSGGQLEAFPNTKAYNSLYQGHRLPLQDGSFLLDEEYNPYSKSLEEFLTAAGWSAAGNDSDLLAQRLEEAYDWYKVQSRRQPQPIDSEFLEQVEYARREIKEGFFYKIRQAVEEGFDDFHQTNDLLLTIGKLGRLLHGLSGKQLIDYIRETVVSCPGYVEYCRHKHEILRRCQDVARWAEKKWSPYRSTPRQTVSYRKIKESLREKTNRNQEREDNARSRIAQAVVYIENSRGVLPRKVGERIELLRSITKELFGISVSDATLKKPENLSLWHPKHREEVHPLTEKFMVQERLEVVAVEEASTPTLTNEVLEAENDQTVTQTTLHSKALSCKPYKKQSRPRDVVCQNDVEKDSPKLASLAECKETVQTLPFMKGNEMDFSKCFYRYTGKTAIATVWKPGGCIEFESITFNQIVQIFELRDVHKNATSHLEHSVFAVVKPKDSNWESGIQIQFSELEFEELSL